MGSVKMNGDVPICDMCGAQMTEFDGWAWHTCPECGNAVRIIDGEVIWQREIFGRQAATYSGRTCISCGQPLAGGEYTAPWENGNNPDGYVKCPHCGAANFEYDD